MFGKEAANSVFDYEKNIATVDTPIDNYIGTQNKGKILAPFPHLVWQIIGLPSNISSEDQKVTLNDAFRNSHKELRDFVNSSGITIQNGGSKKRRSKTYSFYQNVLHRQRKLRKKLRSYEPSYRIRKFARSSTVKLR